MKPFPRYVWKSRIGTITIRFLPEAGKWGIEIHGTVWDLGDTPEDCVSNVYSHVTCCSEWDDCPQDSPDSLADWKIQQS